MYQITCDNLILHDFRLDNRIVLSPKLNLETGKNGTLSFTVPSQNECYNEIQPKKSIIKVFQIDKINKQTIKTELFRGTAFSITADFYNRKQVECEGELSFFNDTIVRPYNFQGDVDTLFKQIINNHNSQVNEEKRFNPRNCTVTDPNNYITRSNINYPTTKSELDDKLINLLGGHFETGEDENGRFIDYLVNYDRKASQNIEFAKNLLDITQCIKTEDVATRIIPLGKKDDDGNYLTIKDINNGLDYVQDDAAVALFGVIEKTVNYDDVTEAENLLSKAKQDLENYINSTVSIELSAADLHNLDVNIEAFRIGDNVRVISKPHGLDRYFLLSKLSLALDSVSSCSMTLGATFKSFTQKQIENEKMLDANVKKNIDNVKNLNTNVIAIGENVQKLDKNVKTLSESIVQIPGQYVQSESFEQYKKEVNQKLYNVYTIKGSVATYNDLPAIAENGDVYNVLDTGANYVCTDQNTWDKLSETIDLSEYLKNEDAKLQFVSLEDYKKLLVRVEELENKNSDSENSGTGTENNEGGID